MIESIGNFFGSLFGGGIPSSNPSVVGSPWGNLTKTGNASYSLNPSSISSANTGNLMSKSSLMSLGSFASSLMSMSAARQQGRLQKKAYMLQSRQENLMARQVEINAEEQANQIRNQLLDDLSSATAFFAASGLSGSGLARAAENKSRRNAMQDINALNRQTSMQTLFMRGQAKQTAFEGQAAKIRGRMQALQEIPNLAQSGSSLYGAVGGFFNG